MEHVYLTNIQRMRLSIARPWASTAASGVQLTAVNGQIKAKKTVTHRAGDVDFTV